jgi:shikimate kinase
MAIKKIVILTGPKHSGKSTVGKMLASKTGRLFFDTDALMETAQNKPVGEILAEGRDVFEAAETEAIREILLRGEKSGGGMVIATGGGLCDNEEAFALFRARKDSAVIFLKTSAAGAWKRVETSAERKGALPLFLQTENPKETHRALHERRNALYEAAADIVLESDGLSPAAAVDALKERLLHV